MKSKGLEPWIHSKVGGRYRGSPKLTVEKSGKNTPKIMKKKNDTYNLETRFTHKDHLY
jgi:hypothetical protein